MFLVPTLPLNLMEPGTGPHGCDPLCGGPYKSKVTGLLVYNQLVYQLFKLSSSVFEVLKTCGFHTYANNLLSSPVCLFLTILFPPILGLAKVMLI